MNRASRRATEPSSAALLRRLSVHLFSVLTACAAIPSVSADAPGQRLPVFRIVTEDMRPTEVGAALGRQWKERFPDLEQRHDAHLAQRLNQQGFDRLLNERVAPLRAQGIDRAYLAELQGLASALNLIGRNRLGDGFLSMDELMLAQLLPDLGGDGQGCGFGVYGTHAGKAGPLVGRNLDGGRGGSGITSTLGAITVYQHPEGMLVNIGVAGILGVTTGFNDRGLFLAHLAASLTPDRGASPVQGRAIGFALRRALEEHDDSAAAVRTLRRGRYGSSYSVLLADRRRIQVLEQPADGPARLREAGSRTRPTMDWGRTEQIAVVDCFALTTTPSNCQDLRDRYRWQRLRTLARFEPRGPRAEIPDLIGIMLDRTTPPYEIYGEETLQVMVFAPRTADLYLYARSEPGTGHDEPVMHRYADLVGDSATAGAGFNLLLAVVWILIAFLLSATLWVRFRVRI